MKHNPIDKDKTVENPGLLPYAHHLGSAIIKPVDQGKTKGQAMKAMYQQTSGQLEQIKDQVELLVKQAQKIHDRIALSEIIYNAECGFKALVGHSYTLYLHQEKSKYLLSLLTPQDWGKSCPYTYVAKVTLLADHTWQIEDKNENIKL